MSTRGKEIGGLLAAICAICAPIIAYYEGYVPHTYADAVDVPTACYGHTGADVVPGETYTLAECRALLDQDVREHLDGIMACIDAELPSHEWAALASLAYNVGVGAVCDSTIARMIRRGEPASVWCEQFDRWVWAGGRKLPGLIKRRAGEKMLCLGLVR